MVWLTGLRIQSSPLLRGQEGEEGRDEGDWRKNLGKREGGEKWKICAREGWALINSCAIKMSTGECFGTIITPKENSSKIEKKGGPPFFENPGPPTVYIQYIRRKLLTCTRHIFI